MTIKRSLSLITLFTIFVWLIWICFFLLIDPQIAGIFGLVIFFLSLFLALLGTLTLFLTLLRLRFLKNKDGIFFKIAISFRQAIWLATFFVGLLLLQTFEFLNKWSIIILFLFFFLLELIFLVRKKKIYPQ